MPQQLQIRKPDDIARLPWKSGNKELLLRMCEEFVFTLKKKQDQRKSLYLMCKHGMGDTAKISDFDLRVFFEVLQEVGD